jgi:hypothetical protein
MMVRVCGRQAAVTMATWVEVVVPMVCAVSFDAYYSPGWGVLPHGCTLLIWLAVQRFKRLSSPPWPGALRGGVVPISGTRRPIFVKPCASLPFVLIVYLFSCMAWPEGRPLLSYLCFV